MILHVDPNAPWYVRAAADAALAGHVGGGTVGIAAGFTAAFARKGGRLHRAAGNVFFVAMLAAYGVGAVVAPMIHEPGNSLGGLFAIYLTVTGWTAVKRAEGQIGHVEAIACLAVAGAGVVLAAMAWLGARDPRPLAGVPWQVFAALAVASALAALADFKVLRLGGLVGPDRLARHLWRMCFAFFFGTGSLFLGQPKVFPPALRGSLPLIVLALFPVGLMAVWLIRIRFTRRAAASVALAPAQEALT